MAESVQSHMESMAEDFLELKRIKLFTDSELKVFIRKRHDYEWKINGVAKNLADIQEAIKHEKFFLKEIFKRRVKKQMADRKKTVDYRIMNRIKSYYEIGCLRYPENYEFALNYFRYIKAIKTYNSSTAHLLKNLIERFHHMPEIFEIASSWFKKADKKEALNIIHRGIALHPDSKDLYLDAFELELKRKTPDKEERLLTYVRGVFKNIKSFQFIVDILKLLEQYEETNKVQTEIIDRLLEHYSDEEIIWDMLAKRELNGIQYKGLIESSVDDLSSKSTKNCLKRCVETYEIGMSRLSTEKKSLLNIFLLDTLIGVQKQNFNVANIFKASLLKEKLEETKRVGLVKLKERHYAAWIDLCEDDQSVLNLLEEGTKSLPDSCLLWKLYLKFYILKDNSKEVKDIFEKSIKGLGDKAVTIWEVMIDYHYLRLNNILTEALYLRAIETQPEKISSVFKPRYLSWLLLNKGVQEARDFYNKYAKETPYCMDLHKEMAKIEEMECFQPNMENWKNCLRLMCQQFGNQQVDVWISYIKFYLDKYKGLDANEKILEIYSEAQTMLPDVLVPDFKEKFDSLKVDSWIKKSTGCNTAASTSCDRISC